jgi:hypothetical protein
MESRFFNALRSVLRDHAEGSITAEIAVEAIRRLTPIGLREKEANEAFQYGPHLDDLTREEMAADESYSRSRIQQECSDVIAFVRENEKG